MMNGRFGLSTSLIPCPLKRALHSNAYFVTSVLSEMDLLFYVISFSTLNGLMLQPVASLAPSHTCTVVRCFT